MELVAKAQDVTKSAGALARAAADKIDDVRCGTADVLHSAASSVRTTGRQSAKAIDGFSCGAAATLDAVGTAVKKYKMKNIPDSLRKAVKTYPTGSLIVATACGFLAASYIRGLRSDG